MRSILILLALLLVPAAPAAAAPDQLMTFEAPRELLDDSTRDETLDEIRSFGIDTVRILLYWNSVAPNASGKARPSGFVATDPGSAGYDWSRYDRLFAATDARGMKVLVTLTGPVPRWATKSRRDQVTRPRAKEFERFAEAAGRRYGDRVTTWSIWNEPNHPQFLQPQYRKRRATSPRIYRGLFIAGRRGLKRAPGVAGDRILMGETAPRGNANVVAPLRFLRGALCLSSSYRKRSGCSRLRIGGYAHHAYTTKAGPSFRPSNPDDVTIGALSRLTRALDRAARAQAINRRVGIYLTEFGIQSAPDPFVGVSLARQAEYLGIAERIAFYNRRVRSFSQYLLRDDQPRPGGRAARYGGFESGLRHSDGRTKPSYRAFRLPLAIRDLGRTAIVWGRVRPVRGQTTVTLQYRSKKGGWRTVKRLTTDGAGVFGARVGNRSGRRFRVKWVSPSGVSHYGAAVRAY